MYMKCMRRFNKIISCFALIMIIMAQSCTGIGGIHEFHEYQTYWIQPIDPDNETDIKWSDYLYEHLKNRVADPTLVAHHSEKPESDVVLKVKIGTDASMANEYTIDISHDEIALTGRRKGSTMWLLYQFMSAAANDDERISADDLYPNSLDMADCTGDFAFEYRGFYAPSNMDLEIMPIIASHNIDTDWGLWGHNLRKCFKDGLPTEAQALVDGVRSQHQLCFSSEALYNAVERYIKYNYGEDPDLAAKFMIMPDDNFLVCQCEECKEKGNTPTDASPAVISLAKRLARRFPYHEIYITSYATTKNIPTYRLPDNMGIMVSAIDFKMCGHADHRREFQEMLNRSKRVTDRVYVWEYGRNFDDYLTPFPCYTIMANRLRFYRDNGVRGVFINGSGYNYSTLTYMRTYVFSVLMINPDADIRDMMRRFLKMWYPKTHETIYEYYCHLEDRALEAPKGLPFYSGIREAVDAYLDPEEFEAFFNKLSGMVQSTEGRERKLLNRLLTGLSFTRLELMRISDRMYDRSAVAKPIATLSDHSAYDNMKNYREAYGDIDDYLEKWERLEDIKPYVLSSLLKGRNLHVFSDLDEDYNDPSILTDGLVGFSTDYHTNWMINSHKVLDLEIPSDLIKPGRKIVVSAMHAPRWNIAAPSVIELKVGSKVVASTTVPVPDVEPGKAVRSTSSVVIPSSVGNGKMHLRVKVSPAYPKFAIDEISIYNS